MLRARVNARRDVLPVAVRRPEQADGERHELHDLGFRRFQEASHSGVVLRRHERRAVLRLDVDHVSLLLAPYQKEGAQILGRKP